MDRLALPSTKESADVEDNFRKTVGQLIGGAAVLIGAGFALFQFLQQQYAAQEQQRTSQIQFREQQQASHDLLISNQVSKGFEQLAGAKIEMRLGGIYALEGVMNDKTSPQYHQPVLEALCAFVREKTIEKTASKDKPATDVQAAVTVIGRRIKGPGTVNLANVSIPVANLERADLGDADLSFATLTKANLTSANLSGADLESATLSGADLSDANLRDANLSGAKLSDANLRGAKLLGANLFNATLSGADLSSANLSGAKLTQTQLDGACGDANTAGRPQTTKAVLAAACSISADYANYRAHSARPARSPAVRETRRRRGWAAVPRNTPSLAPQRRGDWSDAPLTHVPPTCRRSFSNFSTAGTSHIRNWKWGFDRGVGRLGVVRHNLVQKSRDQDALWPKRQGFNVLATRKPMVSPRTAP